MEEGTWATPKFHKSAPRRPPVIKTPEGVTPIDELRRQTQNARRAAEALRERFIGTGEFERLFKEQSEQK